MPESSDGQTPPAGGGSGGGDNNNRRNNNNNRNRNRNRCHQVRNTKFEGAEKDLSGEVYDITMDSQKSYARMTKTIAEYVTRTYKNAGDF
jgi:hypothetical protein